MGRGWTDRMRHKLMSERERQREINSALNRNFRKQVLFCCFLIAAESCNYSVELWVWKHLHTQTHKHTDTHSQTETDTQAEVFVCVNAIS